MQRFDYTDMNGRPGICGLTVGTVEDTTYCIMSELTINPGASITNTGLQLINQVKTRLSLPDDTRYFEHYQWANELPHIDEVLVTWDNGQASLIEWQTLDAVFVANLCRYVTFRELDYDA